MGAAEGVRGPRCSPVLSMRRGGAIPGLRVPWLSSAVRRTAKPHVNSGSGDQVTAGEERRGAACCALNFGRGKPRPYESAVRRWVAWVRHTADRATAHGRGGRTGTPSGCPCHPIFLTAAGKKNADPFLRTRSTSFRRFAPIRQPEDGPPDVGNVRRRRDSCKPGKPHTQVLACSGRMQ